ncbi:MAG: glycosyltransferase family 2 protein [Thermoplasmata archaeon]|nr:glycosyltransferase family 2 protein [Thermoplasmata archaeon]
MLASALPPAVPPGMLTVLLPVHNEADSIERVLDEVGRVVVEPTHAKLIVCEDGSSDLSPTVLKQAAAQRTMELHLHPERLGYGGAAAFGMRLVQTPVLFFMDSDGQYDPEDFWKLWNSLEGNDLVIGAKVRRSEPFHRTVLALGFHVLARLFTGVRLTDMDCGFRIVRRQVWEELLPEIRHLEYSFWAEFSIRAARRGFHVQEVPIRHRHRLSGVTSIYSPRKLPRIIFEQLTGLVSLSRELGRASTP